MAILSHESQKMANEKSFGRSIASWLKSKRPQLGGSLIRLKTLQHVSKTPGQNSQAILVRNQGIAELTAVP